MIVLQVTSLTAQLKERVPEERKLIPELSKQEAVSRSADIDKSLEPHKPQEENYSHLPVKSGEGVFEIYIQSLELSPESLQSLTCGVSISIIYYDFQVFRLLEISSKFK